MPEDKKLCRDDITAAIVLALGPLDFVYAMWEGGALAGPGQAHRRNERSPGMCAKEVRDVRPVCREGT